MVNNESFKIQAELKKEDFCGLGQQYVITFKYNNDEQIKKMYDIVDILNDNFGIDSKYVEDNYDFIRPYFTDENGYMCPSNSGIIGGICIPKDLLSEFIKRFVEMYGVRVTIGDNIIDNKFNYDEFSIMIESLEHKNVK